MSGDSKTPSLHLINAFLREIQQKGEIPDVAQFLGLHSVDHTLYNLGSFLTSANRHGDTPLLIAARHGHVTVLEVLHRKYGVSLGHQNHDGKTAMHEAAQNGQTECIRYLAKVRSLEVDALKRADWTPLMLACTKDHLPTVESLVEHGSSLSLRNKDGWTPLHIACREGHPDIIRFLLDTDPQCWNTTSKNGRTPLHTAALHGRLETIKLLHSRCSYNADSADSCGVRPLMDAARGNHVTVIELLLDAWGADLEADDILGRQSLHHAAQSGAGDAIEYLVSRGADVNRGASVNFITPLHYAAKEGQVVGIQVLLKFGANPALTDTRGRTALDLARSARDAAESVTLLERLKTVKSKRPFYQQNKQ